MNTAILVTLALWFVSLALALRKIRKAPPIKADRRGRIQVFTTPTN